MWLFTLCISKYTFCRALLISHWRRSYLAMIITLEKDHARYDVIVIQYE